MDHFAIDTGACRARQQRLLQALAPEGLDWVVAGQPEHVQWLTGARFPWLFQQAAAIRCSDGRCWLVAPHAPPEGFAADELVLYEAQWHSTLRNDQRAEVNRQLAGALAGAAPNLATSRVGIEFSTGGHQLPLHPERLMDLEPLLYRLRRRKDPDELALIGQAIAATRRMYERAREIIAPGIGELEVFNQLQAAAVDACGERLTATGNDYQCGSPGGPPRRGRTAQPGELYILDLGPAFRGYFADNCRTIAVTEADDLQHEAWEHVVSVFPLIEREVRPGASAKQLFAQAQALLDEAPRGKFTHHLGHGFGLFPHEAPHLNPHWDDVFEEGDVFTVEPGLYAPELRAGLRIENNYQVTADGVRCLTDFPLDF